MTGPNRVVARGRPSPVLTLCRQCIQFIHAGTPRCPHCLGDPNVASERYREGGFAAVEAMRRIDDLRARRSIDEADART